MKLISLVGFNTIQCDSLIIWQWITFWATLYNLFDPIFNSWLFMAQACAILRHRCYHKTLMALVDSVKMIDIQDFRVVIRGMTAMRSLHGVCCYKYLQ